MSRLSEGLELCGSILHETAKIIKDMVCFKKLFMFW